MRPIAIALLGLALPCGLKAQAPAVSKVTALAVTNTPVTGRGSLSPDGRWIAVAMSEGPTESSIWLVPVGAGEPIRITESGIYALDPSFYPSGDRLVYTVVRAQGDGDRLNLLMTIRVDPKSGRRLGPPRQLSAESALHGTVSPSGQWVAYRTPDLTIRVIPAMGGRARTVARDIRNTYPYITWTPDSKGLFYLARPAAAPDSTPFRVNRVDLAGGRPKEVFKSATAIRAISPTGDRFIVGSSDGAARQRVIRIVDLKGRVLAESPIALTENPMGFSTDGRSLFGFKQDVGAVLRVRSIHNGFQRDLTDGKDYPWIEGWTHDGRVVYSTFGDNSPFTLTVASLDGSPVRHVPVSDARSSSMAVNGTHALVRLQRVQRGGLAPAEVHAVDLRTGQISPLAKAAYEKDMVGRGGLYDVDGDAFLVGQPAGDSVLLQSVTPGSTPRTLRVVSNADWSTRFYAVHGNRVAWPQLLGDSVALMVADGPRGAPRVLSMIGTKPAGVCCRLAAVFSFDGKWIVVGAIGPEPARAKELLLIEVPASGRATNQRKYVVPGDYWYEQRWLPDNSGVTVVSGALSDGDIVFVPFRHDEKPSILSRDDKHAAWGQVVSFDGKYVAYPAEVWRGTKIWKLTW